MSRQTFDMKSEAESVSEEERAHQEFRYCVFRPDTTHIPASLISINSIHHKTPNCCVAISPTNLTGY